MPEDWEAIEAYRKTGYIREIEENLRKVYILDEYKKVVDEVKERIETDLKEKFNDVKFNNDNNVLISCYIKDYLFEISLRDKMIFIAFYKDEHDNGFKCIETFRELLEFIDKVIKGDK